MDNWMNEYLNIYDKHNAKYLFELSTQISTYTFIAIETPVIWDAITLIMTTV